MEYMVSYQERHNMGCGNKCGTLEEIRAYVAKYKKVWQSYSVFRMTPDPIPGVYILIPVLI